jgi:hypothetical protein
MNRISEQNWPAEEPSRDFADTTVERLLASRLGSAETAPRVHRMAWLLVAAVLVSGVALGVALHGRMRPAHRANESLATASAQVAFPKPPETRFPAPEAVDTPVANTAASVRRTPSTLAAPVKAKSTVPAPSAPPRTPKVPACSCQRGYADVICDCY